MEIEPAEIDIVGLDEAALMRGYTHLVQAGPEALTDVGSEDEPWPVGFDEDDCPPCSGDCLAELDNGYLLISEHQDSEAIARLDGWSVQPFPLPQDWELNQEVLYMRVLKLRPDGQVLLVIRGA